jgi:flagellar biosynthetic protein FliR
MLGVQIGSGLAREMLLMTQSIFVTGIKIAAPVMAVLLFVNVGLGIVARTVPQVNVFIVGFPVQMLMGFVFLGLSVPLLVSLLSWDFYGMTKDLKRLLTLLAPDLAEQGRFLIFDGVTE